MIASVRALVSVVMLTGFYVVALAQVAAIVALTWWLAGFLPAGMSLVLTYPMLVAAGGTVAAAAWSALRSRHAPVPGVVVTPLDAGPLWMVVHQVAAQARTRPPDEIRIVADVEAAVAEDTRWLGLRSGRRYLYLGLPLLQTLSSQQVRAVVAHELGHYSLAHTRFGAIAYRGRTAIAGAIGRIHYADPVGWTLRGYRWLYLLADRSVSRRQELQADLQAARAAGSAEASSALIEVDVLASAFAHFVGTQVTPRAKYGPRPDDLYGAFKQFLSESQAALARLREAVVRREGSRWDTHPPLRERLDALTGLAPPAVIDAQLTGDNAELIPGLHDMAIALTPMLIPHAGSMALPWDEFTAAAATAQLQVSTSASLRAVRQRTGADTLAGVLALIGRGEHDLADLVPGLVGLAALRSGQAQWRSSWTGPDQLVGVDGEPLPLAELSRLACRPDGADAVLTRMRALGIDAHTATITHDTHGGLGATLMGGLGNCELTIDRPGGKKYAYVDLLVLDQGLVFIEIIGDRDTEQGNIRMRAILDRAPLHSIAAAHHFVAFEAVHHVTITRRIPLKVRIVLNDGSVLALREPWTGDQLTRDSAKVLLELVSAYEKKS